MVVITILIPFSTSSSGAISTYIINTITKKLSLTTAKTERFYKWKEVDSNNILPLLTYEVMIPLPQTNTVLQHFWFLLF